MATAYDPKIRFEDGREYPLSEVTRDVGSRRHYLKEVVAAGDGVSCMCRIEGVPMGVARRSAPTETFYLYPLHRSDNQRHAYYCPHHEVSEDSGGDDAAKSEVPAIQYGHITLETSGDQVAVHLKSSLAKRHPEEKAEALNKGRKTKKMDTSSRRTPAARLQLLLEVLWDLAEINIWRPYLVGKRGYGVVFKRLTEASRHVLVRTAPLEERLFVPPPWRAEYDEECRKAAEEFVHVLKPRESGLAKYGFVAGRLKEITSRDNTAILSLSHSPHLKLYMAEEFWRRASATLLGGIEAESDGDSTVFILAKVSYMETANKGYLVVEELAALRLYDRQTWLPCARAAEKSLVKSLLDEGRSFRVPMAREIEGCDVLPAAILEDAGDPSPLYIVRDDGEESDGDKASSPTEDLAPWRWNATYADVPMPVLPPVVFSGGKRPLATNER